MSDIVLYIHTHTHTHTALTDSSGRGSAVTCSDRNVSDWLEVSSLSAGFAVSRFHRRSFFRTGGPPVKLVKWSKMMK